MIERYEKGAKVLWKCAQKVNKAFSTLLCPMRRSLLKQKIIANK
jgi:hypothetical protein